MRWFQIWIHPEKGLKSKPVQLLDVSDRNTVESIPPHLNSVWDPFLGLWNVSVDCGVPSEPLSLTVNLEPVSNPMVFCLLPGTRPASVTFCMTACCVTDNTGLTFRTVFDTVSVAIVIEMLPSFISLIGFKAFVSVWNACWVLSACRLPLHLSRACLVSSFPFPSRRLSETQRVPFAVAASVPPAAVGWLQVHSHRLRVLLHVQHQRLPHRLRDPVPAGELQLQDGSHAGYECAEGLVTSQRQNFVLFNNCVGICFEQEPPLFALPSSTKTVLTRL